MKKTLWIFITLLAYTTVWAQKATTQSSKMDVSTLIKAAERENSLFRRNPVMDENNGDTCAKIRILMPYAKGLSFPKAGQVVKVEHLPGECDAYVNTRITKELTIAHESYGQARITVPNNLYPLEKLTVYQVNIDVPAESATFNDLLDLAQDYYNDRGNHTDYDYFSAACLAYENAKRHKDGPTEIQKIHDAFYQEYNHMKDLRTYTNYVEKFEEKRTNLENKYGFEHDSVYIYLCAEGKALQWLEKNHPSPTYFIEKTAEINKLMGKHPKGQYTTDTVQTVERQKINGKVVKVNTNNTMPLNSLSVYVSRDKKVSSKEARTAARRVGSVNADGTFSIIMPDDYSYLFVTGEKEAHYITSDMKELTIEL